MMGRFVTTFLDVNKTSSPRIASFSLHTQLKMAGGLDRWKLAMTVLLLQLVFLVLLGCLSEYGPSANARAPQNRRDVQHHGADPDKNPVKEIYPMFQDVHVMIFVGFGFLMTFLKRYGFSAVGLNMLVAAFVIEWHVIFAGLFHSNFKKIEIDIVSLISADFAAAAVLITFGALLGKTSPLQMIFIGFVEIVIFVINEHFGVHTFMAVDVGGSMFVHVFGAYFGLAVSRVLHDEDCESPKEGSIYHSDIFAMIGTLFLWMFWPSFNSALAVGDDQHRAVVNTYVALAFCCLVAFGFSSLMDRSGRFEMVHVQNATLAGGVAVGTCADLMIEPSGAALIGCVAGLISVIGYNSITPLLARRLKIHDTCGVNNLHGMPGVLAGLCGVAAAGFASTEQYGNSLYEIFPARAPLANTTALHELRANFSYISADGGLDRSAPTQALYQLIALGVTLAVAVVGGALTGLLLKIPVCNQPRALRLYDDEPVWVTPDDFNADTENYRPKREPLIDAHA